MRRLGDLQVEVDEGARAAGVESMPRCVCELKEAIKLYEGLLDAHPDYARNDAVMYQLSRAYEAQASPRRRSLCSISWSRSYPHSQ